MASDYVDVSDIFGGSGFGIQRHLRLVPSAAAASRGGHVTRTRCRDMGIRLAITLEEAAAGCRKTISYDRLAPCDDCGGNWFFRKADRSSPVVAARVPVW